jgi:conjugal transfer ATP-binding protein TraC
LLIGQMLAQNPRVFILDIGASYQKTCEFLEGQYINFSATSGLTINPFDIGAAREPSDEKIKFLVALIEIMTKEDGDRRLGRLERAEIEQAIQDLYKREIKPRLSLLQNLLLSSETPEVARIGKILGPWCGDSPFGKIIDRDTNIEFQKPVVCFDLKGLESTPDLQAVSLFIITDLVWREIQRDRTQMKFLVFDECWKLLESDAGAQFIAEVFRTFRKYYASAIAISQNIDDFAKSRAAAAIMPNSSTKWILRQKGADKDRLKTVLSLNDREISLVDSLSQVKGKFSEAFLMCEDERGVVSIESTPLEYWLATTDPRDFALLKDTEKETGLKGASLLRHLADQFPTGVLRK